MVQEHERAAVRAKGRGRLLGENVASAQRCTPFKCTSHCGRIPIRGALSIQRKERAMDVTHFDAWTRRRFGLAAGGLLSALFTLDLPMVTAKKKKRKKKRCSKHKRRCQGTCIKRSQCCGDGDCPPGTFCCRGACASLDSPCEEGGLYACFSEADGGKLRRSVEGDVYCTRTSDLPMCAQCESSDGCLPDERCFSASCGDDVTAVCRKVYTDF
jgi:hypothetical protein